MAISPALQRITIDRALVLAAVDALERAETKAGHLALRVTQEHLGYCGYRGGYRSCSPVCIEHKALVAALREALG